MTDEDAVRHGAEEMASVLAAAGFPRMQGRVVMALTVSESGRMTADELSASLGVSAASISGAVRALERYGMVRRLSSAGSRRHVYALPDHAWYTASLTKTEVYVALGRLAQKTSALVEQDSPSQVRLREMADFYEFLSERIPQLFDEWLALRPAE